MRRTLFWAEFVLFAVTTAVLGYVACVGISGRLVQMHGRMKINENHQQFIPAAPKEGTLLGEIRIPRIGVSSVILEGTEDNTLRKAVGHIHGTALPGRAGNICLAGHRDTFFRPLRRIAEGDEILITSSPGQVTYRVQSVQIVGPEDVQVLDQTTSDTLTLVTCYPFHYVGTAPKRFIVRAVRTAART